MLLKEGLRIGKIAYTVDGTVFLLNNRAGLECYKYIGVIVTWC